MFMPSVLMILPFVCFSNGLPSIIKLGGLFETDEEEQQTVFDIAVNWINEDEKVLPKSTLVAYKESHESDNSFEVSKKVCKLLSFGMAGIFGPQSPVSATHVQSISDALEVPHIETRWDYKHKRDDLSINLHP
ncbi:Glutamate receptor, ionotropic kainate 2, partial [Stegodyphus mimosarum]